jgi:radical SAM protein with 4Fe4S-binding SPASM domain
VEGNPYFTKVNLNKASPWKGKGPLLGSLDMELTERCNNNCIHCYINLRADDLTARERELSTEEIKGILREAASLGCLRVRLTGGEPLLREDFQEIYISARKLGLKALLFTNATLITPHLAELFARIPPLEKIEISFYGLKKESYEGVTRTPGSFEAAWRGIHLLLERKVPLIVKSALLPSNKDEVEKFEAWASTIPWMDKPPSYGMFFSLRCRRDVKEKNNLIKELRISSEEGLRIFTKKQGEYLNEKKEFCSKFIGVPGEKLFSCGSGIAGGCVDAYGYFQPCMELRHPDTVHNLKKGSLKNALVDFFPRIREMKATNQEYLRRCARCFLKGLCDQCPAKSWMEYGTLDTPVEYLCEIAHTQAVYLGLIKENERAWEVRDWKERIENFSGKWPMMKEMSEAEVGGICR